MSHQNTNDINGINSNNDANNGDLSNTINELSKDPNLAWLKDLSTNKDVNIQWNQVATEYKNWNHEEQGLTPQAALVISLAVFIATSGMGAQVAGALGLAEGTIGGAMVASGFSTLVSQAAVSLIANQGDIGKVL